MWRQLGSEVLKIFLISPASVKGCDKEVTAYLCWSQPATCYPNRLMTLNYIRLAGLAPLAEVLFSALIYTLRCPRAYVNNIYSHVLCGHLKSIVGRRVGDMYSSSSFQILPSHLSSRLHGSQLLDGTA